MKFLEKYKLYRSVIRQNPSDSFASEKKLMDLTYKQPYIVKYIRYNTDNYRIEAYLDDYIKTSGIKKGLFIILFWMNWPIQHRAHIYKKNSDFLVGDFNSLLAKRLFNHGKKYSK